MKNKARIFALLLVFLFLFLPTAILAEDGDDGEETLPENWKPYSLVCEEGKTQATLHMHPVYAERGNVDLYDAFVEASAAGMSLYVGIGDVKLHLSTKLVSDIAERGEPVLLSIKELKAASDEGAGSSDGTERDELPLDARYAFDLGFPFDTRSVRISIKHPTKNADGLHVLVSSGSGDATVLKSAYSDSLVSFFPEDSKFTLRITEEPLPERASPLPLLLAAFLLLLVAGSAVLILLLKKGTLKRIYLNRIGE